MEAQRARFIEMAKSILNHSEKLEHFAKLHGVSVAFAKATLEQFLREPEVSEKTLSYIFQADNPELTSYYAGEEVGYQKGYHLGWVKGLVTGVAITVIGIAIGRKFSK